MWAPFFFLQGVIIRVEVLKVWFGIFLDPFNNHLKVESRIGGFGVIQELTEVQVGCYHRFCCFRYQEKSALHLKWDDLR